ncbi:MAG: tetratricopeptide repeat protein [Desulfobacteraceae bacterium]|nr:tetratricopeptide repeat protein [Desulfobacteraceae bacterium]
MLARTTALAAWLLAGTCAAPHAQAFADEEIPLPVQLVLHKAQTLMGNDRIDEAIALLAEADVPEGRRHYLISFFLGNGYLMTGKPESAQRHFSASVALKPDFQPGWLNLAKSRYDLGAFQSASEAFLHAYQIGVEPDPMLLYYAGASRLAAEDYTGALTVFQRLLREHPHAIRLEWREAMVQVDLALNRSRQALEHLEILAEQSEGERRTRWQEMLLYHYLSLEMREQALNLVQRLTREAPLETRWWKGQVHLFLEQGRTREALIALSIKDLVERLDRRETELLGDLHLSFGIPQEAARAYRRVLDEGFRIETARKLLEAYRRQHLSEKALEWAEKILERAPADGDLLLAKADLLFEGQQWEAAAAAYRQALPHAKSKGRLWWMLGYCAAEAGDREKARTAWQRAATFKAYRQRAGHLLEQLEQAEPSEVRTVRP